jgi:hypothetical protein
MFCNQCRTELQADYNLCPKCGTPVGRLAQPAAVAGQGRLQRHLRTLGILWIAVGALFLIPSAVLMTLGSVSHIAIPGTEEIGRMVGPSLLSFIGTLFLLVGGAQICVGWGLMRRQSWARVAALILGIISLFHPPFGTALGIYTLWVLLAHNAGTEYQQLARAGS